MKEGAKNLNKVLINWVGLGTGYVPLSNMLSEFCTLSPEDEESLIPLLIKDGAAVRLKTLQNGINRVYIWLK